MKKLTHKSNQKGFTIIEVLIVLAIAGLIMLVVFLAVPALQRNSRNTQARGGAAAVLSAVNESMANNNGAMPSAVTIAPTGAISVTPTGGVAAVISKTQGGYLASVSTTAPAAGTTGTFAVATNRKCNGNVLLAGTFNRAIAVLYNIETSGGTTPQCSEG